MRTVTYRLADLQRASISIGFVGENEYTRVQFDALKVFDEYPSAIPSLSVVNPAGTAYPAVVTHDGDYVIWDVQDSDLAVQGRGEAQLTFTSDGVVVKSYVFRTVIDRSVVANGETPDPVQNWLDEAADVLEEVEEAIPAGGTKGQVLAKKSNADRDLEWVDQTGGGGGGTSDYEQLSNKPQIAGTTLSGNKTLADLGIASAESVNAKYTKPGTGIPSSDMASAVQTSLGKADSAYQKPVSGIPAADIADGVIQDPTSIIDDTAGEGDTDKVLSADKVTEELTSLSSAIAKVTPEQFGAKGDGTTDDSEAVQAACNAGYEVRFADNKTYYLASTVTIDHDVHLVGGKNTVIKTKTPTGGNAPNGIVVTGTLKKTTTLTSDYSATGTTPNNVANRFELTDMTGINIGDIMVIEATDQYYNLNRQYYYLGGTLMVSDMAGDYLYTCDAMPWNIENTENVSVKIYSAPTAVIENINFESDLETSGSYHYCLLLDYCKNSVIKNCNIKNMDNGLRIWECVNTLVDGMMLQSTPGAGETNIDHYGVSIYSSSNTSIKRVVGECANSLVDLSGNTPNMNTYIMNCMLFSSNRVNGLGMHENAYNTVVEDCVIGGMIGYGFLTVKNCRFVQHNRQADSDTAITYRGSHVAEWSKLLMLDCVFEGNNLAVLIAQPVTQTAIRAYDHIVGDVTIKNCSGGRFIYNPSTTAQILSNTINRMIIDNWRDCYEFYHTGNTIKSLQVSNTSFIFSPWCNKHSGVFSTDGIQNLYVTNFDPLEEKLFAEITKGADYYLPKNVPITFASSSGTDHFVVCGKNIASNIPTDYQIGDVSGSTGNALSRTVNNNFASALSTNNDDELVFTQPVSTSAQTATYAKCLTYVGRRSRVRMSCKMKNTGATNGTSWRPYIAIVDASTGKVTYRGNGSLVTTTAEGVTATHYRDVPADSYVLCYLYCSTAIAGAVTTISDFVVNIMSDDFLADTITFEKYEGSARDGSGTLNSVDGINYIMANAAGSFTAKFKANLLE